MPYDINLTYDTGIQDGVLHLEHKAPYKRRINFGPENQPVTGFFFDQGTQTGLKIRTL